MIDLASGARAVARSGPEPRRLSAGARQIICLLRACVLRLNPTVASAKLYPISARHQFDPESGTI